MQWAACELSCICDNWRSHSGAAEDSSLLGSYIVSTGKYISTFRRTVIPSCGTTVNKALVFLAYQYLLSFLLILTSFYLTTESVDGYCCSWSHSVTHTVGRTPLEEGSVRRRDLYLTTHNTHKIQTSIPPGGIRTHNLSRRAAEDLRLRSRGHWDRLYHYLQQLNPVTMRSPYGRTWRSARVAVTVRYWEEDYTRTRLSSNQ
jgi:hypothetical protein